MAQPGTSPAAGPAAFPPLSARSVALSLLLGSRPGRLPVRDLTRLGALFGIAPSAMRAALSRMAATGELTTLDSTYGLTERHLRRQATVERLLHPDRQPFDGSWTMLVVVARGRAAPERSSLRAGLIARRFGELREGVWLRPANLGEPVPTEPDLTCFTTVPDRPHDLCRTLWDLDAWTLHAGQLLAAMSGPGQSLDRFTAAAAAVRHLQTDPALPDELLPDDWPGERLRTAYEDYRAELAALVSGDPRP